MDSTKHQDDSDPGATPEKAFIALVHDHEEEIFAFFYKQVSDRDTAWDLTQGVLLRAWKAWNTFDRQRPPWPWLQAIARNHLTDHLRRKSTQEQICSGENGEFDVISRSAQEEPLKKLCKKEERALVRILVDRLNPRHKRLIKQRYFEHLTIDKMAEHDDTTVATVTSALSRARKNLTRLAIASGIGPDVEAGRAIHGGPES